MDVLLITIGSAGDVHPFVALGAALRRRGHAVALATLSLFRPLAERAGLEFIELGTFEAYRHVAENPHVWHPVRGFRVIFADVMIPLLRPTYELIVRRFVPHQTIVVAHGIAFGARIAQERLGVPTVTVHLAPAVLRSVDDTPRLPGLPVRPWMPRWAKRAAYHLADRTVIDPLLAPAINALRGELGLDPVQGIMDQWWHSPTRAIGLFPAWFAPPQPDWPRQLAVTGFPLFDDATSRPPEPGLERFLESGPAPIVFTAGSAMMHAQAFFAQSIAAARLLNRRAVLVAAHAGQIPPNLPESVLHVEFAPFSQLLRRAAAFVHHGGIGTCAQALAAGIPMLVMPMAHDQPDNAARVLRLGVASVISPSRYRARAVARVLYRLINGGAAAAAGRRIASRFAGTSPLNDACDLVEQAAGPAACVTPNATP